MYEYSASRLSNLINEEKYYSAHHKMMDLVISLKQDFQLEGMFDEVLFRHEVGLTSGAQLILIIPIIEAAFAQSQREVRDIYNPILDTNLNTLQDSVEQIIEEAKSSPASADVVPQELLVRSDVQGREWQFLSSISLFKAISRRFCNIPPFCGETD